MNPGYILVVDDEPEIRRLVQEILEDEHYQVAGAENAAAARELFRRRRPDLVLLDVWMPDTDGISLLKEWSKNGALDTPVVIMSGHGSVETAVQATRLGAYDFIEKPLSMGKLLVTVERALENEQLRRENLRLRHQSEPGGVLLGRSQAMQQLRAALDHIARSDASALISGEPGSGKAAAARYLHARSTRKDGPYVEVSLAAIAAPNVARHLFGSESGEEVVRGSFEQANHGTLLLEEIGDLDTANQARLAHALQQRRFARGDGLTPVEFDVRVLGSVRRDLAPAVQEGRFREDLYYQINVVPVSVPPLRDHREDVPELANFYRDWMVDHERLPFRRFTTGALNALRNYSWTGNVRELKNVVQRLLILNRGEEIGESEVEQTLGARRAAPEPERYPPSLFEMPLRIAREQFERAYLEFHLARTGGNVAELARLAEMERTHLYRKLKNLGIGPRSPKDESP